jgi:hypothetical protein
MNAQEAKKKADDYHKENDDDIEAILVNIEAESSEGSYLLCWFDNLNKFQIDKLRGLHFKVCRHNPKFKHPHYTIHWSELK